MATKDKILAYVRKTPANTNVNVLGTMLDSIAQGGNTPMIVRMDTEGMTDKTWQQMHDALADGTLVYVLSILSSGSSDADTDVVAHAPVLMVAGGSGNYGAVMMSVSLDGSSVQTTMLIADSADSYLRAITDAG